MPTFRGPLPTDPAAASVARPHVGRWKGRPVAPVGLAIALLTVTGCGVPRSLSPTATAPQIRASELTDAGGRPCPRELAIGDDPSGHGFGVEETAHQLPALLKPQEAWLCEYHAVDVEAAPNGGMTYGWRRSGPAEPVTAGDLPDLTSALNDLDLPDSDRLCTSDLGPRWMVVYAHDGDLTGVVVDDYGCRDVRLTDDPHNTPPGAGDQDGTVSGVLNGGTEILDALGAGRPR